MSVHVEWGNPEKTAIRWSFMGRWTWGELDDAAKTMQLMFDSVDYAVALIVDVTHMSILPPDVISRMKNEYQEQPPKFGGLIVVGADENLRLFWDTFTALPYAAQWKAHFFETLEEARQFVRDEPGG